MLFYQISYLIFQTLIDPSSAALKNRMPRSKIIISLFLMQGTVLTFAEIFCYIYLFRYLHNYNNTNATHILDVGVINKRNRTNAISLTGVNFNQFLFYWWLLYSQKYRPFYNLKTYFLTCNTLQLFGLLKMFSGLFASWIMEVWFLLLMAFVSVFFDGTLFREIASIVKYFEYYFIPLVQIKTSSPIKSYVIRSHRARKQNWFRG